MYKIYNKETEKDLRFKNLSEVERFLRCQMYNLGENINRRYSGIGYQKYYEITYGGQKIYFRNVEALNYKYAMDSNGNPLYIVMIFISGEDIAVYKTVKSYNINETVQKLMEEKLSK